MQAKVCVLVLALCWLFVLPVTSADHGAGSSYMQPSSWVSEEYGDTAEERILTIGVTCKPGSLNLMCAVQVIHIQDDRRAHGSHWRHLDFHYELWSNGDMYSYTYRYEGGSPSITCDNIVGGVIDKVCGVLPIAYKANCRDWNAHFDLGEDCP